MSFRNVKLLLLIIGLSFCVSHADAQQLAVKSNMLYWGTATPNLGIEFGLGKRTTFNVEGGYNPFQFNKNQKWKHWLVQPEFRLWTCERFNRGFWAIHAIGGQFNAGHVDLPTQIFQGLGFGTYDKDRTEYYGLKNNRYEGWMAGAGIGYGYQWYLSPRWSLEAEFAFGYMYIDFDRYCDQKCGSIKDSGHHHYWGPTKAALSFVYYFKFKKNKI